MKIVSIPMVALALGLASSSFGASVGGFCTAGYTLVDDREYLQFYKDAGGQMKAKDALKFFDLINTNENDWICVVAKDQTNNSGTNVNSGQDNPDHILNAIDDKNN